MVQALHELLSDLASHITQMRTDNMFRGIARDLDPPSSSEHSFHMDPKDMVEHIKLQESVKQATIQKSRRKQFSNRPRPNSLPAATSPQEPYQMANRSATQSFSSNTNNGSSTNFQTGFPSHPPPTRRH
ncbi:MAG: hypothetical protein EXX96DRAFT_624164 [Benjaminiella poitrasii]|nr:MAG: hypothetical protein EXX96DRAFT_624164 [Benjaminiella poitrasii]